MKDTHILPETALLLRDMDFIISKSSYYWHNEKTKITKPKLHKHQFLIDYNIDDIMLFAPTQSLVQKYLREERGYWVEVKRVRTCELGNKYGQKWEDDSYSNYIDYAFNTYKYTIESRNRKVKEKIFEDDTDATTNITIIKYEDVLEEGLQEALREIIRTKDFKDRDWIIEDLKHQNHFLDELLDISEAKDDRQEKLFEYWNRTYKGREVECKCGCKMKMEQTRVEIYCSDDWTWESYGGSAGLKYFCKECGELIEWQQRVEN